MPAGFRLPPRINDGAFAFADDVIVPIPRFGVDRLAHCAKNPQIREIIFLDRVVACRHQSADCCGGCVELVDLVFFTDGPEPACIGVGGHTFKHDRGRAIRQWAIDDIAVPRDPADIGRAPEDIAFVVIEHHLMRHGGIGQIPAGCVHDTLGLTGRAGSIENKQRIFGVHLGGGAVVVRLKCHFVVIIVAVRPGGLAASPLDDQTFYLVFAVQQRCIRVGLQRCLAASAWGFVCGDHNLGVTAIDPRTQRVRRKTGKDDGMDRANPRAGQHRISGFRDHGEVDHDPVAFAHAQRFKNIGHLTNAAVQVFVSDVQGFVVRIIGFPDDRRLIAACFKVAVDAVGRDIQHTVFEPFDRDTAKGEIDILHLGKRFDPVKTLALFPPERIRISQ